MSGCSCGAKVNGGFCTDACYKASALKEQPVNSCDKIVFELYSGPQRVTKFSESTLWVCSHDIWDTAVSHFPKDCQPTCKQYYTKKNAEGLTIPDKDRPV
jgi:hypothetical protein